MSLNTQISRFIEKQQVSTLFFTILLLYFLLVFFSKQFIETKETLLLTYDKLSVIEQEKIVAMRKTGDLRPYIFQFLFLLFCMLYYSFFIYTGTVLARKKINIKLIYKLVLMAEIINVLLLAASLFILYTRVPLNLNTVKYYTPLSLSSVLPNIDMQSYTTIILSSANVFFVFYLLLLSFLLRPHLSEPFGKTLAFTTVYAGIGYGILIVIKILFAYLGGI